jgi:hypothetical protein
VSSLLSDGLGASVLMGRVIRGLHGYVQNIDLECLGSESKVQT